MKPIFLRFSSCDGVMHCPLHLSENDIDGRASAQANAILHVELC